MATEPARVAAAARAVAATLRQRTANSISSVNFDQRAFERILLAVRPRAGFERGPVAQGLLLRGRIGAGFVGIDVLAAGIHVLGLGEILARQRRIERFGFAPAFAWAFGLFGADRLALVALQAGP